MELMCVTMWKRTASKGIYSFVGVYRIVTKKHKQKHPSKKKKKERHY